MKNVHVFVPVFLYVVTMLIFQDKRISSSEKWCNYFVPFFLKMPKIWVGQTTVNGEKKRMALPGRIIDPLLASGLCTTNNMTEPTRAIAVCISDSVVHRNGGGFFFVGGGGGRKPMVRCQAKRTRGKLPSHKVLRSYHTFKDGARSVPFNQSDLRSGVFFVFFFLSPRLSNEKGRGTSDRRLFNQVRVRYRIINVQSCISYGNKSVFLY